MKKFLSLVLSLAMTLSLVTIGAGATEYKNLSDKGEIQYEEAVAVLNKLGIITGYEDGSFKPTGALTRGAAAKIIVSMMIGADAASALTVAAAPYKDVPVTNTFAAVISYCKTKGYINGYTDGTFRPTAALSGFAFTKMLLGALGYDGTQENFTGSGWTMNVASLGQTAGLFNDFDPAFSGNGTVDRQSACLLALNTLKATEVKYSGGTNITTSTGNATTSVSTNKERSYVTSNNTKINKNIVTGDADSATGNYYTLEFGEDHFQDLRLEQGNFSDDFGRPSNKWSYKNVTIGTYALTPDYTYTTSPDGDTAADEVKSMGLKDFKFVKNVDTGTVYSNTDTDVKFTVQVNGADFTIGAADVTGNHTSTYNTNKEILEFIADKMTGKGVQVEVYLKDGTADTIQSVVVIYTQMMQVNAVKSSEVTLKVLDDPADDAYFEQGTTTEAKKQYDAGTDTLVYKTQTVNSVKDDDDCYSTVKNLKADDFVLVTPVLDTGSTYKVASVAVPQVVTGSLTSIKVNSSNSTVKAITVGGTAYDMSKMWSAEDDNLKADTKISTSKDATAYLDAFGYAIYAKDVVASNSTIVIDEITSSLVDSRIVKTATGWDYNGNALSINLGTKTLDHAESWYQGKTFEYQTSTSNNADYALVATDGTGLVREVTTNIVAGDSKLGGFYFDSGVKFVFLSKDADDTTDVTGITVHDGVTEVGSTDKTYPLTYILNKDKNKIVAVVVPNDDDAANTANLLYFQKVTNHINNTDGKTVAIFTAYIDGVKVTDCQLNKDLTGSEYNDKFFTYSKNDSTGVYTLSSYVKTDKATAVVTARTLTVADIINKTYINLGDTANLKDLNAKNATVIDLYTDDGKDYSSLKEINDSGKLTFTVSAIFNGNDDVSGYKTVSYLFITANGASANGFTFDYTAGGGSFKVYDTQANAIANGTEGLIDADKTYTAGSKLYVVANTALAKLSSSATEMTLVGFTAANKAVYQLTPNANFADTSFTETAAMFATVDNLSGVAATFKDENGAALADKAIVADGDKIFVTANVALNKIISVTGAKAGSLKLETAPAATGDKAVYSFVVDGAAADISAVAETAGWVNLSDVTTFTGGTPGADLTIKISADKTIAAIGETVTYTITLGGTSGVAGVDDTIDFVFAGLNSASVAAISGAYPTNATFDTSNGQVKISANSTPTSGVFTVTGWVKDNTVPAANYADN